MSLHETITSIAKANGCMAAWFLLQQQVMTIPISNSDKQALDNILKKNELEHSEFSRHLHENLANPAGLEYLHNFKVFAVFDRTTFSFSFPETIRLPGPVDASNTALSKAWRAIDTSFSNQLTAMRKKQNNSENRDEKTDVFLAFVDLRELTLKCWRIIITDVLQPYQLYEAKKLPRKECREKFEGAKTAINGYIEDYETRFTTYQLAEESKTLAIKVRQLIKMDLTKMEAAIKALSGVKLTRSLPTFPSFRNKAPITKIVPMMQAFTDTRPNPKPSRYREYATSISVPKRRSASDQRLNYYTSLGMRQTSCAASVPSTTTVVNPLKVK